MRHMMIGNQMMRTNGKMKSNFVKLYNKQIDFQQMILEEKAKEGKPSFALPQDDIDWFTYHMRAMVEELGEVTKADKRWKTYRNENFNQEEKVDELADVFITAMNLAIYSGLSGQDVYDAIKRKIKENIKRANNWREEHE